jgi:hypothetical protein
LRRNVASLDGPLSKSRSFIRGRIERSGLLRGARAGDLRAKRSLWYLATVD